MTQEDWTNKLRDLAQRFPIVLRQGVSEPTLLDVESVVGKLPDDLRSFYKATNGLRYEWFHVVPIEDPANMAKTWDGLKRANNQQTTKFLPLRGDLLERFLIVAEISGGHCACIDRQDGSIWFHEGDGMYQTDMTLSDFIEVCLREVAEL